MNKRPHLLLFILSLLTATAFCPLSSFAKTEVIYASYKYTMGDNDTRQEAKRLCFIGAKRRLIEKAGTFIISTSEARDFQLTKNQIITYSAGFISPEIVEEKVVTTGDTLEVFMILRANVDMEDVKETLNKLVNDTVLREQIERQNERIVAVENKMEYYLNRVVVANYNKSSQLRRERMEAIDAYHVETEAIREIIMAKRRRDTERANTIASKAEIVRTVLSHVELGMTPQEVREIIRIITGDTLSNDYVWDRFSFSFRSDKHTSSLSLISVTYVDPNWAIEEVIVVNNRRNIFRNAKSKRSADRLGQIVPVSDPSEQQALDRAWKYVWGKEV